MSQSLFRLSINTARSIKITSNSSFCECLSCLLLKHCFQFRKICAFFFICFCSRIFCTFQVILRLFSFNFNFNCNRAQLAPQSVRLYCGSALRCRNWIFNSYAYVSPRTPGWLFTYVFCTCLSILRLAHRNLFLCFVIHRNASAAFFANFRRD